MFRVAVTSSQFNEPLVHLSLLTGIEAVVLHFNIFAKFWVGIYNNKTTNRYGVITGDSDREVTEISTLFQL